jgi:lipopolysaccharide assembly outer membrane protein LptD (OstA)
MRTCAVALVLFTLPLSPGISQQPAELKHFSINSPKGWSVNISAENMAREALILHLKGNVEIRTSIGQDAPRQFLLLRADEADFHIDTGAIEPRGNVIVRPQNPQDR